MSFDFFVLFEKSLDTREPALDRLPFDLVSFLEVVSPPMEGSLARLPKFNEFYSPTLLVGLVAYSSFLVLYSGAGVMISMN